MPGLTYVTYESVQLLPWGRATSFVSMYGSGRCIGTVAASKAGELMNTWHLILLVAIVLLVPLSRVARARWVPITIGLFFSLLQLLILTLWLDAKVRAQLVAEIEANREVQHVSKAARIVVHAQMPMRLAAGLASVGLFVTICCWSGASRARRFDSVDKK